MNARRKPSSRATFPEYGRAASVARRERTASTHPDWTKAHAKTDAMRVMTKLLISDLWSEWTRPGNSLNPGPQVGASISSPGQEAKP